MKHSYEFFFLFVRNIFQQMPSTIFFNFYLFIYLTALSLGCFAWAFASCSRWGLLIVVVSLLVEYGL